MKEVPYEINAGAKLLFVGEAPGEEEEYSGLPFQGKAGQRLNIGIERCGKRRDDAHYCNLSRRRPYLNNLPYIFKTKEFKEDLNTLAEVIESLDPAIIVTLGAWPTYFLNGYNDGGSLEPQRGMPGFTKPEFGARLTIPTYHPSFIERAQGFNQHTIFYSDLKRAFNLSEDPSLYGWKHETLTNPEGNDLHRMLDLMYTNPTSVDIETFMGTKLACIGFCPDVSVGMCITYQASPHTFKLIHEYMADASANKTFQFGNFDVIWLQRFADMTTRGYTWDTYIASATLMPEFSRSLNFLQSIYTYFPYHKDDRKNHKEGGNIQTLWDYNVCDVVSTQTISLHQMEEMKNEYGSAELGKVA